MSFAKYRNLILVFKDIAAIADRTPGKYLPTPATGSKSGAAGPEVRAAIALNTYHPRNAKIIFQICPLRPIWCYHPLWRDVVGWSAVAA